MLLYDMKLALASAILNNCESPFIFHNAKTIVSVDFNICQLMLINGKNNYYSKICEGCYSAILLNVYKRLRKKIENLPSPNEPGQLEKFNRSLIELKKYIPGMKRIRFYSFSDFSPGHIPYIKLAAKYFEVDIISKALCFKNNRKHLIDLLNTENVYLSLSFNSNFMQEFDSIVNVIKEYDNAHLNYTLNYEKENPDELPFKHLISVWHLKNERKRYILDQKRFKIFDETNMCGVFDGDGNRNTYKTTIRNGHNRISEKKGSCHSCNNCRCSLKKLLAGGKSDLPDKLIESQ